MRDGVCARRMQGKMTHELASTTKAWTTLRGRETVALGRELLGGNGIVSDFLVRCRHDASPQELARKSPVIRCSCDTLLSDCPVTSSVPRVASMPGSSQLLLAGAQCATGLRWMLSCCLL